MLNKKLKKKHVSSLFSVASFTSFACVFKSLSNLMYIADNMDENLAVYARV